MVWLGGFQIIICEFVNFKQTKIMKTLELLFYFLREYQSLKFKMKIEYLKYKTDCEIVLLDKKNELYERQNLTTNK